MSNKTILIYGYGNPGRQDDGVGIECAELIDEWLKSTKLTGVSIDQNYQLNIEDAHKISSYDRVIFVDASITEIENYKLEEIVPDLKTDFSMHSVTPAFVVALCKNIFGKHPQAYQLHIKAYEFKFMQKMTKSANTNLQLAFGFLKEFILESIV